MQQADLLSVFLAPLESRDLKYFVTGSIASIFYGEPRLTHDLDLVLFIGSSNIKDLIALFPIDQFYCPPEEVIEIELRRKPFGHVNLIHHPSGFKADLYLDSGDPLHKWALEHRKRVKLSDDLSLWLAPVEYLIVRKLEFYREGKSTKHLDDIRKMLPEAKIDETFLGTELERRGLSVYWKSL